MLSLFQRSEATDVAHRGLREAALDRLAADVRRGAAAAGLPGEHVDRLFASVLFGMAGGALRAVADDPQLDPAAVADLLTDFTMGGLAAMAPASFATVARPAPDHEEGKP